MRVVLLLGTKKGVFLATSDGRREAWEICGPLTSGTWAMYDVAASGPEVAASGGGWGSTIYAGGASNWYGPAVWWSDDLGQHWRHSSEGLTYGDGGPEIMQVWCVARAHGVLYAGVEPAGLFKSEDGGATWTHLAGLQAHPSRPDWRPATGGLCLHAIVPHPGDSRQLWVAISSAGVFHTGDGGQTWARCDTIAGASRAATASADMAASLGGTLHPCVHALQLAPVPGGSRLTGDGVSGVRLYQQNHGGVYRSDDGGQAWVEITAGLPSGFGFPLAVHPRDPETLYVVPLEDAAPGRRHVPGGRMAVWRSRDGGRHWQELTAGLPAERTSISVLRRALALDPLEPAGVYLGTTTGQVYWSTDEGETWRALPARLPPVFSLALLPVAA